ncbi:ATP-binding cassette domain-containing protein [Campylobacter sp. CCS1377]|uniref:ATP-binding cassette domain-containing protein n=1 Tax=Campylobacter sp. CCS1377 TaxID=3158229 RepID=A0AAU7E7H3_9BACT|nr:ATP-binding cassette domain-containing protein [Campylobacter jejuni]
MLLKLDNVSKFYTLKRHWYLKKEKNCIFKNISFNLAKGQNLLLSGQSGCGKSTLAKMIAMLENIDEGEIKFQNHSLNSLKFEEQRELRKKLQFVFQDQKTALHPCKKVKTLLFDVYQNFSLKVNLEEILAFFDLFELKKEVLELKPFYLSGGQAARIGLIRALIIKPELLILDETTASLDYLSEKKILKFLNKLGEQTLMSCIFISHKNTLIKNYCHKEFSLDKVL